MLVEFSVLPLASETSLSDEIAAVLEIVDEAGLPYQFTPSGTILEGEWEPVIATIQRCHTHLREKHPHVVTTIKIEDEAGATNKLKTNITSVEQRLERSLQT